MSDKLEENAVVPVTVPEKKKKTNYLNNKDMLAQLILSKERGAMTNELANMVMKLSFRYSQHPWFINYSYNEDMRSFALLTVVKMWNNFNPEKGSNAFAYFTQIIKRAFYQFNIQEKKHRNIRDSLLINQGDSPSHTYASEYDSDNDNYFFEKMDNFETEEFKAFNDALSKLDPESPEEIIDAVLEQEVKNEGLIPSEIKVDE